MTLRSDIAEMQQRLQQIRRLSDLARFEVEQLLTRLQQSRQRVKPTKTEDLWLLAVIDSNLVSLKSQLTQSSSQLVLVDEDAKHILDLLDKAKLQPLPSPTRRHHYGRRFTLWACFCPCLTPTIQL